MTSRKEPEVTTTVFHERSKHKKLNLIPGGPIQSRLELQVATDKSVRLVLCLAH